MTHQWALALSLASWQHEQGAVLIAEQDLNAALIRRPLRLAGPAVASTYVRLLA